MIIGLTGTNAAGKSEVANYLIEKGFQYLSLSDIVRRETKDRNLDQTRENLIMVGNVLRTQYGADVLAKRTISDITKKDCVIDSIRNLAEAKAVKSLKDSLLLAVDAPIGIRYKRAKLRATERDNLTLDQFKRLEEQENFKSDKGQQLKLVIQEADKLIINDGNIKQLRQEVDDLL